MITIINTQETTNLDDDYPTDIPKTNCVFVGCSCDGNDEIVILQNSHEITEASPDARTAKEVTYDILCLDEETPFRFTTFPIRDRSRLYSHQILTLDLAGNQLKSIPADRLTDLEISILMLSENKISALSEDAFRGVQKVEVMDLSTNELTDLNEKTFEPIESSLMQLKLNFNQLGQMTVEKLEKVLNNLKKLRALHLGDNSLTELPNIAQLTKLEEVVIRSNQIEFLNDHEQLLPSSLIDLHAEYNRVKVLNANTLSNLPNLKYLNLEANQISSISPDAFAYLSKLIHVHLGKNFLKVLPANVFFSLVDLQRLDLSAQNQALRQIEDYAFDRRANSREIMKIDLSNNGITVIGNKAFCSRNRSHSYVNIKEIDLAQNPLSRNINSCILNQLAKGFTEFHASSSSSNKEQPKVSFKQAPAQESAQTVTLKCDCEIAKSALLVKFEGECTNEQNNKVELKDFKCSSDLTREQVEQSCQLLSEFDCQQNQDSTSTNADTTFKQGVSDKAGNSRPPLPSSASNEDIQKNKNTKLPVRAEVNVNLNENKANVKSNANSLSSFVVLIAAAALIVV